MRLIRFGAAGWLLVAFIGCGGGGTSAATGPKIGDYRLAVTVEGSGAVASSPLAIACGKNCAATFIADTSVKLTAMPGTGYTFAGWSGDGCSGLVNTCSVVMSQARNVTARFEAGAYVLSVSKSGNGTVVSSPAGINCGSDCSGSYAKGSSVSLAATPAAGYVFSGWSGACSGSGACTVSMSSSKSVSANFTSSVSMNTLTVTNAGGGKITSAPSGIDCGSDCSQAYAAGTVVTMTAQPSAGYSFQGWSGACTGAGAGTGKCSVTMNGARAVTATFSAITGTDGACTDFYADNFELVSGKVVMPWSTSPKPTRGVAMRESQYDTCRVRVTDHAVDGLSTFARNDYSRRQAFNADNTRQLVYALDGYWHLYDQNNKHLMRLPQAIAADAEPQWHPTDPDLLYYLPTNGVGMKVYRMDITTLKSETVGDLAARLKARWPAANSAWTKSEGSPSADARYWCFMVDSSSWSGLGLVVWDMVNDQILGYKDLNGQRPDHVSMSPTGDYCVSSSYGGPGVVVYNRDFSSSRKIANVGEHSDIGLDANGDDAYVSIDYQAADGAIFMVNLRTGKRTDLFPTYVNGTASAIHVSAKAFRKPGWFVLSAYGESTNRPPYDQQWFHRKITVVQMAANPKIYNLATTHSKTLGYWTEPQASVNRDLTKVVWTSNWDLNSELDTDVYMIQIPPSAVK
jgi:Divergent InlB B-repeat domain